MKPFLVTILLCAAFCGCAKIDTCVAQEKSLEIEPVRLVVQSGHAGAILDASMSPNESYLVTGAKDYLKLWKMPDGKELRTFRSDSEIWSVSFLNDSKRILIGYSDHSLVIKDIISGKDLTYIKGYYDGLSNVAVSNDGNYVATRSQKNTLFIWDIETGEPITSFSSHSSQITSVAFSPSGQHILSSDKREIHIHNIKTGELELKVDTKREKVRSIATSSDGMFFLSGGKRGIVLREISTGKIVWQRKETKGDVLKVSISPDSRYAISAGTDNSVKVYELSSGKKIKEYKLFGWVLSAKILHDSRSILACSSNEVRLWDLFGDNEGKTITNRRSGVLPIRSVLFSRDSNYIFSLSEDFIGEKEVNIKPDIIKGIWDVVLGKKINHKESLAQILNTEHDSRLKESNSRTHNKNQVIRRIENFTNQGIHEPNDLSPDGKQLASVHTTGSISVWDAETGQTVSVYGGLYQGHRGTPSSLKFSNDGKYLFSGGLDGEIIKWDLKTHHKTVFEGHESAVDSLDVSLGGSRLVSAGIDGTIRLWDVRNGKEIITIYDFRDASLFITPEGYFYGNGNFSQYIHFVKGMEVIGFNQLYDVFYRPDIVRMRLKGQDVSHMATVTVDEALTNPPPEAEFVSRLSKTDQIGVKICYQIKSKGGGIGEIRVFHNGKLIKSDGFYRESVNKMLNGKIEVTQKDIRGKLLPIETIDYADSPIMSQSKGNAVEECINLESISGKNEISVAAFNASNTVQGALRSISFVSSQKPRTPHLYILAVGINTYQRKSENLQFAVKDAKDFSRKLSSKMNTIFKPENVHIFNLLDSQAKKEDILEKVNELASRVKQDDIFIFFNASHGLLLQNQYYIITADFDGQIDQYKGMISSNEIVEMSKKIKAFSQLFVFDTCHAGGVDYIISGLYDARMASLAHKTGLHVFASAGSYQSAVDGYKGNGLYTHTLLSGMDHGDIADSGDDGVVSIKELGDYSKMKTTEITTQIGFSQTPVIINFGQDRALYKVQIHQ
ncbi:caspase family protein [bacterium]|nr:caspase family protein [bacterium]